MLRFFVYPSAGTRDTGDVRGALSEYRDQIDRNAAVDPELADRFIAVEFRSRVWTLSREVLRIQAPLERERGMPLGITLRDQSVRSFAIATALAMACCRCTSSASDDGDTATHDAASAHDSLDAPAEDAAARQLRPPEHRDAAACPDYAAIREGFECTAGGSTRECTTDSDCPGGLCQPAFRVGSPVCSCVPLECASDDDCSSGEACACAVAHPDDMGQLGCDLGQGNRCQSRCLPATCRVDEDCPEGDFCAVYYDFCGAPQGFACWGPGEVECGDASDCGEMNVTCEFDGDTWRCTDAGAICD